MEHYTYTYGHLNALKKYRQMKILFLTLSCLVVLLQSISWLVVWCKDIEISTSNMVFVTITLIASILFMFSQVFFLFRNKKIMREIEIEGKFETVRLGLRFSNKASWAGAFVFLIKILALLFVVLLGLLIVNFVQDYLNWGKIILKVPFMVFLAVGFLNTSAELKFQTMIEKVK
jgi:hypothetical protein